MKRLIVLLALALSLAAAQPAEAGPVVRGVGAVGRVAFRGARAAVRGAAKGVKRLAHPLSGC